MQNILRIILPTYTISSFSHYLFDIEYYRAHSYTTKGNILLTPNLTNGIDAPYDLMALIKHYDSHYDDSDFEIYGK
jgi:hypothetical protein